MESTILATIRQHQYNEDNLEIRLSQTEDNSLVVLWLPDREEMTLTGPEADEALADPDSYLAGLARDWAMEADDARLEMYRWGLADPAEDEAAARESTGRFRVLRVAQFCDHDPIDWVADNDGRTLIFDSRSDAKAWVDEEESGVYRLRHGEASRPQYYILPA